jgi:hypothetical protein
MGDLPFFGNLIEIVWHSFIKGTIRSVCPGPDNILSGCIFITILYLRGENKFILLSPCVDYIINSEVSSTPHRWTSEELYSVVYNFG